MEIEYASPVPAEINILVVIDTEYIKSMYPNPSKDMSKPTGIAHDHQYMLCTGSRGIIGGQGTGDLNFKAIVGDYVKFAGVSIYQNSRDAVIIYDIKKYNGDDVFDGFVYKKLTRSRAVVPDVSKPNGLPPIQKELTFNTFNSGIGGGGTEYFNVAFGLYALDDDGQTQSLYGYFYWDPIVTVPK